MTEHISEDAALYALGALNEDERAAIERHADRCAPCAKILAQACDDVAAICASGTAVAAPRDLDARMATAFERGGAVSLVNRPSVRRAPAALAAAVALVIVALGPSAYLLQQNRAMNETMLAQSAAMARIAASPHRVATFASNMDARVMYGRDGSWYCIIVHGAGAPVQVAWKHDGEMTMLGTAMPHGDVAVLYLPKSHRMDRLALVEQSRVIGQAQLVF